MFYVLSFKFYRSCNRGFSSDVAHVVLIQTLSGFAIIPSVFLSVETAVLEYGSDITFALA